MNGFLQTTDDFLYISHLIRNKMSRQVPGSISKVKENQREMVLIETFNRASIFVMNRTEFTRFYSYQSYQMNMDVTLPKLIYTMAKQ